MQMKVHARIRPSVMCEPCPKISGVTLTCRPVKVPQVQRMRVVRLPGGEEHRQAWHQSGEDSGFAGSQSHGSSLEEGAQGAVQAVNAVVEELTEATRGAGSARLFAVDIVHGLVHEETKSEAIIQPRGTLLVAVSACPLVLHPLRQGG